MGIIKNSISKIQSDKFRNNVEKNLELKGRYFLEEEEVAFLISLVQIETIRRLYILNQVDSTSSIEAIMINVLAHITKKELELAEANCYAILEILQHRRGVNIE